MKRSNCKWFSTALEKLPCAPSLLVRAQSLLSVVAYIAIEYPPSFKVMKENPPEFSKISSYQKHSQFVFVLICLRALSGNNKLNFTEN